MSNAIPMEAGPPDAGDHLGSDTVPRDLMMPGDRAKVPPLMVDATRGAHQREPNPAPTTAWNVFLAILGAVSLLVMVGMEAGWLG